MPYSRPPPAPPPPRSNVPRIPNDHRIQFYNAEQSLFDSISRFILPSFFSSEHAVVIVATKAHLDALDVYLRQQNLVPEVLLKREQMMFAPAEALLKQLMPNGLIEEQVFFNHFGPIFHRIQKRFPRLLVYGELVNILCEKGEHEKAHELEEVWESFLQDKHVSLLCGYDMNVFSTRGLDDVFQRICRSHSHVEPADDTSDSTNAISLLSRPEDQQIVLAMLQQKTLRLEAEMTRRAAVETTLSATLEHLGSTPLESQREDSGGVDLMPLSPIGVMAATTIVGHTDYFFNRRFLELSGLTSEIVREGSGWIAAVHYEDRERVNRDIRLYDGKARRSEYRFVLPNGSIRWVNGESTSRESGYVHTAIDISRQRMSPAVESAKSSAGGWKRNIENSQESSSSNENTPNQRNLLFTKNARENNPIAVEMKRITRFLWDNLWPPTPPGYNLALIDPATKNIFAKLATLNEWNRSWNPLFLSNSSAVDLSHDDHQKANIRLIRIGYLGTIILLSRFALVRSIERGHLPQQQSDSPSSSSSGCTKNEADDIQIAEGCINAAIEAVNYVHSLVSPSPPTTISSVSSVVQAEVRAEFNDMRSSRMVLGVFFCSSLTVLLYLSIEPSFDGTGTGTSSIARKRIPGPTLLAKIQQTLDDLYSIPAAHDYAVRYQKALQPFTDPIAAAINNRMATTATTTSTNSTNTIQTPSDITWVQEIIEILKRPNAGGDWMPYPNPWWNWADLLMTPSAPPLNEGGNRSSRSTNTGDGNSTKARRGPSPDKRARLDTASGNEKHKHHRQPHTHHHHQYGSNGDYAGINSTNNGARLNVISSTAASAKRGSVSDGATVSPELEALFRRNNPR